MLEQLFGSKTRVRLLHLFLSHPNQHYYLRELARGLKMQLNSVRREVTNLEKMGILKVVEIQDEQHQEEGRGSKKTKKSQKKGAKKYFMIDIEFILYPELKALFLKSKLILEKNFVNKIKSMNKVKMLVLTGIFVGTDGSSTDMLIIGSVNKAKLAQMIKGFQKDLSSEINYTVMTVQEYKYRKDMTDRFLYNILESKKIVILNELDNN